MNIAHTDRLVAVSTDLDDALTLLIDKGGYDPEQLAPLARWLDRGDDVIVFANHDLGSLATRALFVVMPWERDEPTPRQAPDSNAVGPGWRYLPELRVTVEEVTS